MRAARCLKSSSVVPSKRVKVRERERERERERDNLFTLLGISGACHPCAGVIASPTPSLYRSLLWNVKVMPKGCANLLSLYRSILGWTRTDGVGFEKGGGFEKCWFRKFWFEKFWFRKVLVLKSFGFEKKNGFDNCCWHPTGSILFYILNPRFQS